MPQADSMGVVRRRRDFVRQRPAARRRHRLPPVSAPSVLPWWC